MRPLAARCYHGDCRNLGHKQHCVADVSLMEGLVLGLWLLFPGTRQGCYDMPPPKIDEKGAWSCTLSGGLGLSTSSAPHCLDIWPAFQESAAKVSIPSHRRARLSTPRTFLSKKLQESQGRETCDPHVRGSSVLLSEDRKCQRQVVRLMLWRKAYLSDVIFQTKPTVFNESTMAFCFFGDCPQALFSRSSFLPH